MKSIKLEKLELTNFRNIQHAVYKFTERTAISGHNFTGKSNTINAIAWLLTGKLMSGVDDSPSIKPLSDTKQEVIVTAFFSVDGGEFVVSKSYKERWVTPRGGTVAKLETHDTVYTINDIKYTKITEAVNTIYTRFGLPFPTTKFDFMRALTNPLYYEQLPWQDLLAFITSIIPVVDESKIFEIEPIAILAKPIIDKYQGDTSKAMTYAKQEKANAGLTKSQLEIGIKTLRETQDVPEAQLVEATQKVAEAQRKIAEIRTSSNVVDPAIGEKAELIRNLNDQLIKLEASEKKSVFDANTSTYAKLNKLRDQLSDKFTERGFIITDKQSKEAQRSIDQATLAADRKSLAEKQGERGTLITEYKELKARTFVPPEESHCPQCQFLLNQDQIDNARAEYEKKLASDLENNINRGKAVKLAIDDLTLRISQRETSMAVALEGITHLTEQIQTLANEYETIRGEIEAENAKIVIYSKSQAVIELEARIATENAALQGLRAVKPENVDKNRLINDIAAQAAPYQITLDAHTHYLATQTTIKEKEIALALANTKASEADDMVLSIEKYLATKLDLLKANVKSVFGEVEFVLAEPNIKEGSWNQVCYPLIVGTKVPFEHGSTSEKIITGIAITESIKKAMRELPDENERIELPDITIYFDEGEALDSDTIANRLKTKSQIITAVVNDTYKTPTAVDLASRRVVG